MTDQPDDNPFARNSAWPKMPQAPFRVGPMPKAAAAEPLPVSPPQQITPLFVRPIEMPPTARLATGGAVPPIAAEPVTPLAQPAIVGAPTPAAPIPLEAVADEPASEESIEVSEVIVTPVRRGRANTRRLPWPAIIASAVGVAGVLALAWLLSEAQKMALTPKAVLPAVQAVTPVTVPEAPPTATAPVLTTEAPAPIASVSRAAVIPPRLPRVRPAASGPPMSEPSSATTEALSAPALDLPEAPPPPTYTPPPAPDPAAPVVTRVPNS